LLQPSAEPNFAEPPAHRRTGPRAAIPAAVKRAVWARDQGRCTWPLDAGGCCGSTRRLELDHIIPWADWGGDQEANLRLTCAAHNRLAARQVFGERVMGRYRGVREPVAEYGALYAGEHATTSMQRLPRGIGPT
jgi:5-methylcytosine-specific restriction endonuclease McrA